MRNSAEEIVVTGASGFIGGHVCEALQRTGYAVRCFSRTVPRLDDGAKKWVAFDIANPPKDCSAFEGAQAVIHLAGRAHVFNDQSGDPLAEYIKVNTEGAKHIAELAVRAGVKRFVFVSSIGVNGNATLDIPFTERSRPNPVDLYARSKYQAELALAEMAAKSGLELVIVRPPLVYGPGNPGNFLKLLKLVKSGIPIPVGSINNRRSFIYVGNLASALIECARHPAAANQTYLVSDGYDVSTSELVEQIALHMGRASRVFSMPPSLLSLLGRIAGKADALEKLTGSLIVDSSKIRNQLGWSPPVDFHEGLKKTVEWFQNKDQTL